MAKAYDAFKPDELIIALPSESGDVIRRIVGQASELKLSYKTIPSLQELISGKISISELRNVDLEDLLRRKQVELNTDQIEQYIEGKRILITGAGGSIGSEIVRQVSEFKPESICLLGRGENSIHSIVLDIKKHFNQIPITIKIADVRDIDTLEKIFDEIQPEVVFHAAAHKHVPLMEMNPAQAIFNNVGGTRNLAKLSLEYGVKHFVNISTDKAINPTSVMGASKRIAEFAVQDASLKAKDGQSFVSVRFGNVLGSRGSVIPIFREQIKNGGPVTITDPEMARYFMTIPEASQLVLQAGALNQNGSVYVLDMGEPVKIYDMACDLIRLSGYEPEKDIKIKFTGIRPGEKLFEELLTSEEGAVMSEHEKIFVARRNGIPENFEQKLDRLFTASSNGDGHAIRTMIQNLIPSYSGMNSQKSKN
jgi:FlaA1/EpsC-like NDP-sugar epimerase